jgi:hypothetical protein
MRQSSDRILLGDNIGGGVVMPGVGVWISTGLRCIHIYIYVNVTPGHAYAGTDGRQEV